MKTYALSTMWGIGRFPGLGTFFRQGAEAGFPGFELNHGVTSPLLAGMGGARIQSVHEPCPADISTAELKRRDWLVSSLDEEKRKAGVGRVRASIDLAAKLGARAVVVHPGRVDSSSDTESLMRELYDAGAGGSARYLDLLERNRRERAAAAPANLDRALRSISELARYASGLGIALGLENRYHYHQLPSPDELEALMDCGPRGSVGFWYDTGHAETMSRMGFYPHGEWLRRFSDRIVGVHLHDVSGLVDHRPAGSGTMPWADIAGRIPAHALRTCEFANDCSPGELSSGLRFLETLSI